MSDRDFDQVFGARPEPRKTFVERVGQGQPLTGRHDPITSIAIEAATENLAVGAYKAYGSIPAKTDNPSCEIRNWMDGTEIPDGLVFFYRLLLGIDFTGTNELRLRLPDSTVVLQGRNLTPLREALTRQLATYVQRYSPKVWRVLPAPGDTIVERIDVIRA